MFDKIATEWSQKRQHPWENFTILFKSAFKKWQQSRLYSLIELPPIILDMGGGSGRHSEFFQNYCQRLINLDISRPMLKLDSQCTFKIQASMTHLPIRNHVVDGICAVASIHHIKGIHSRDLVIYEINRIGKLSAFICVTVWRFFQPKFIQEYRKQMNSYCNSSISEIGDVIVPWNLNEKTGDTEYEKIDRFYHLFRMNEFTHLIKSFQKIERRTFGNAELKNNYFFFGYLSQLPMTL